MKSYPVDRYHQVPSHVKEILMRLQKEGITAYIVGGAVRDLWLGREPQDFDLASTASPEQIAGLFEKTLDVGKQFGIMVVVTAGGPVEIARFRTDGAYTDNRHPANVQFANPEEDARRRDFTVNALFYDPIKGEVIDFVGGVPDLEARVLRTVGKPEERFAEDALRMLRAFRFHSQLVFNLDPSLPHAVTKLAANLRAVSRERITKEMEKAFESPAPFLALQDLYLTGLWEEVFLCEVPPLAEFRALEKFPRLDPAGYQKEILLAAIRAVCPDFSWEKAFLLSKETKKNATRAFTLAKEILNFPSLSLGEKKLLLAEELFSPLCDWLAIKNPGLEWLPELRDLKEEMEREGRIAPAPLVNGQDLTAAGIPAGPNLGKILASVRLAQLNEEIRSREEALALAKRLKEP